MKKILTCLVLPFISLTAAYAVESTSAETVAVEIPLESPLSLTFARNMRPQSKIIRFNKIHLDAQNEHKFEVNAQKIQAEQEINGINQIPNYLLDSDFDVDLKMSDVPVLDQGPYGTCVTFAATAALDAIKESGDYASQQCLLELGNTYEAKALEDENDDYEVCKPSGWNGYNVGCSLGRIKKHGVVAKTSCPDSYPMDEESDLITKKLSFDEYKELSQGQWSQDFMWHPLRNPSSTFDVKRALNSGHRVLISTLMNTEHLRSSIGYPVNGKKAALWALPRDAYSLEEFINEVRNSPAGHAMVITGYSDSKQVFKIRNSWGTLAGDNGEYYMTYDYFRMMNQESIEIGGI